MNFNVKGQLLLIYSANIKQSRENGLKLDSVSAIYTVNIKEDYDLDRNEILYNILNEFGILMKLIKLIKMCLNETYSKAWMDKSLTYLS